ncbi:MAG: metalloregulator ArsR/SmtB family transcription factor [Coriobacteriia bacterium]|nr:metalloregulator ArsR/SmtB family transcription factor [Coriobacteriia bacterium]
MVTSTKANTENLDAVFKALASSRRREILAMLSATDSEAAKTCCAAHEVCACKISGRLGLSASTTSHHMSILRDAGLVTGRNEGTWTYYTLRRDGLAAAAEALISF